LPLISTSRPSADGKGFDCTCSMTQQANCWSTAPSLVARQGDGVGGLDEVGRGVVLPEQPRHPDREEVRLARVREVDRADPAAVLLEHDAAPLERARRLALAQEGAVQVAVIGLLDLGVGDQVVEKVGAANGMDVFVGLAPSSSSILRLMSWHFFLTTPGVGLAASRSKSISVCAVTPNSVNRS
jgi:hypothetical protein